MSRETAAKILGEDPEIEEWVMDQIILVKEKMKTKEKAEAEVAGAGSRMDLDEGVSRGAGAVV